MQKIISFLFFSSLLICPLFAQPRLHLLDDYTSLYSGIFGISSDGRFAAGGVEDGVAVIFDTKTEEITEIGMDIRACASAVSNAKKIVGTAVDSAISTTFTSGFIWENNRLSYLGVRLPKVSVGSLPYAITGDGKYIVGSTPVLKEEIPPEDPDQFMSANVACKWSNNGRDIEILKQANKWGMGSRAASISDNGRIITGFVVDAIGNENRPAIWIDNNNPLLVETEESAGYSFISRNGRYVIINYESAKTLLWDFTKQDEFKELKAADSSLGYLGQAVSNGGIVVGFFCNMRIEGESRFPINNPMERIGAIQLPGKDPVVLDEFVENYGIYVKDRNVRITTPICISKDGRFIGGFAWSDVNRGMVPFILDMGAPLDPMDTDTTQYPNYPAVVSIENPKSIESSFHLYPNPASDILNIQGAYESIRIFDMQGKEVFVSKNPVESICVKAFKSGMYFVRTESKTGTQSKKLIIR